MDKKTDLLSPICAARLAWAQTGAFPKDVKSSNEIANMAQQELERIAKKGAEADDEAERRYIREAMPIMISCMRTLDILYKERSLNYKQNEDLRSVLFNRAKEYKEFGGKLGDFIKSIPSVSVVTATGATVALIQVVDHLPVLARAGAVIAATGIGLGVNIWWIHRRGDIEMANYMRLDYERGLYYLQYLGRVRKVLKALYEHVDQLHETHSGQRYPLPPDATMDRVIEEVMVGLKPLQCPHIHKHMARRCVVRWRIQPDLWARCDAGGDAAKECQHYPEEK